MYNVIVADDEKNIREGIVELIEWEKLGCKVCASMQNGAQVLKYLEEEKIHVDIIITDIKMPIMDGMELIGMLNERFPDIKVIILTAYSDFTYAQQAIKFQVSDFVVKNDFFLELPRAVKKIIEQCEVDAKKCVGREKEIPFFQGEACRVCACEMRDIERYDYEVCKNRIEEILNSTFLDHKVVVAEGESGMLIFVIEYKGSEENAAWFQRRLEKVVSIAKIFQNIRLRIGAGKVVKSAEWSPRIFSGHRKTSMPCPAACRLPGQSGTGAVYTTDPLYGLFSDSTSQDTAPSLFLCNADARNYRHSRAWMLHSTYAR